MPERRPEVLIRISRNRKVLTVSNAGHPGQDPLFTAQIVSGCEDSGTPTGTYKAGKWIKDKTNPTHGPVPWSKDPWANPYGPYFLPLNDATTGRYTTYGIHGTRGPLFGDFEKPPVPESLLRLFMDDDDARYLYCSHGCVRMSNQNISALYRLLVSPGYAGAWVTVVID